MGFVAEAGQTSKVVFHTDRDGNNEIYIMNDDGTSQTRLTNNSANDEYPTLCQKVNKIVFSSDRAGAQAGKFDIWVMNINRTGLTNLTPNTAYSSETEPHCGLTDNSANMVVFRSNRDGNDEIYRVNTDQTGLVRLTDNDLQDINPQWCGESIIFSRDLLGAPPCGGGPANPGTDYQLYLMDDRGEACLGCSAARELTCTHNDDPGSNCTPSPAEAILYYWPTCHANADGGQDIAFSAYQPAVYLAREIFRMPLCDDGCCADSLADLTVLTDNNAEDDYPSWSPGGTSIAFASNRLGGDGTSDWEIYKMPSDDGEPVTALTTNAAADEDPHWGEVGP